MSDFFLRLRTGKTLYVLAYESYYWTLTVFTGIYGCQNNQGYVRPLYKLNSIYAISFPQQASVVWNEIHHDY